VFSAKKANNGAVDANAILMKKLLIDKTVALFSEDISILI
tara:strand:+ start:757 stop:876 length:120 start_codon:yes stop_codon:yes gene_type:complete